MESPDFLSFQTRTGYGGGPGYSSEPPYRPRRCPSRASAEIPNTLHGDQIVLIVPHALKLHVLKLAQ
ncbi:hypothetical protein, partial [Bilophila wadsworthia]|uniref:hypothetical protein n=1 Tax=Bilophila wadsworthia TaxID=35833 RepID=UPI00307B97A7